MSETFEVRRASAGGLVRSYVRWGRRDRPVMVLLHGLSGHARMWDAFARAMAFEYRVVVPDQRGHGDTEWPRPPAYESADFVEDLRSLADLLDIGRFVLVGLSMGAHNALAFACRYPDRVDRLVSVDVPPRIPLPRDREALAGSDPDRIGFATIEDAFAAERPVYPLSTEEVVMHRVRHNLKRRDDGRWTWKHSPDVARRWNPQDLSEAIREIGCPTLVVRGAKSEVFAPEVAAAMADAIPHAALSTVEGSGHSVPMDRPAEFEELVRRFLRS